MECDRCGAERPRTGPCPECGAPPPAPYSSRGRSQAGGASSSGSRRSSGTNVGGGRGGLLSRGGQGGDDGGDWDDGRSGRGRSAGRQSSPGYGYEPDNDSRALVPQYGQPMPPAVEGEMVSIPGFPQS